MSASITRLFRKALQKGHTSRCAIGVQSGRHQLLRLKLERDSAPDVGGDTRRVACIGTRIPNHRTFQTSGDDPVAIRAELCAVHWACSLGVSAQKLASVGIP